MLVVEDQRAIVLNSSINAEIARAVPHAKALTRNDEHLLVVPHGVEEAIVLRNMGITVPSPINYYYDWPARFEPMQHQKETSEFLVSNKKALCLNSPGSGKTISAIWAADFLLSMGKAKKVLIVAPLSTVKEVWGRELKSHLPHRQFGIATGSKAQRQRVLDTPGIQYVIINHDGFTTMSKELKGFDVVIYDEATALKNPSTVRFKKFYYWCRDNQPWLWLLTGTPITQSPVDAWSLARLIDSPHITRSYTSFREKVMQKVTQFKWVARPDALDTCKKVLQPSIRFTLDECIDLPQTNFVNRVTALSKAQEKAFEQMREKAVVVFQEGEVSAANSAVLLSKLLQICCGVVYTEDGSIKVDSKNRYDTLVELLGEIGDKAIVFVPLKGVQKHLMESLKADGFDVALVNGDVGKKERDQIFNDFQHTDTPQILLAHPKVAAHGLTLTRARDIIWYAPIYSLEQYEQANARIRRLSTQGKTSVWHILATKFEAELYRRLREKQNVLTEFLGLVQGINTDSDF
jgi:SNF2 family DNA or RNA helicase